MARTNAATKREKKYTHEGATAWGHATPEQELRRSVMACMLWEDTFYESGEDIATRILGLVERVPAETVRDIAIEARNEMKLRHVPLMLCVALAKLPTHKHVVADTVAEVVQRPDEITELLALYSRERTGTQKLNKMSHQIKNGLKRAFPKFSEYALAKYNRDGAIKLKDALLMINPRPKDPEQSALWKRLIENKLEVPDTWEVALSATKGEGKKQEWERLLREDKLGALALLRNLRNMKQAGVQETLIRSALLNMKTERVLPFRFVAAASYVPQWEPELETAMFKCLEGQEKLSGKTCIVVDNSGSMYGAKVSKKSEMDRSDAACALAILVREVCEHATVIGFATDAKVIAPRRGFALRDAIKKGPEGGTNTQHALNLAAKEGYDRIIVITDEQSHQTITAPVAGTKGYFINVASYQNGIGYGPWVHCDGWSEAIVDYIRAYETFKEDRS